jgi:hypothetical protein
MIILDLRSKAQQNIRRVWFSPVSIRFVLFKWEAVFEFHYGVKRGTPCD